MSGSHDTHIQDGRPCPERSPVAEVHSQRLQAVSQLGQRLQAFWGKRASLKAEMLQGPQPGDLLGSKGDALGAKLEWQGSKATAAANSG